MKENGWILNSYHYTASSHFVFHEQVQPLYDKTYTQDKSRANTHHQQQHTDEDDYSGLVLAAVTIAR
uniref:Transposase n=1 Tax=Syphacia muris TaxID=451379 RepID=A0A0N5A9A5_9BILA